MAILLLIKMMTFSIQRVSKMKDIKWEDYKNETLKEKNITHKKLLKSIILCILLTIFQISFIYTLQNFNFAPSRNISVVTLNRSMKMGDIISPQDIIYTNISFNAIKEFFNNNSDLDYFIGKKLITNVNENNFILRNFVQGHIKSTLTDKIPYGKRLFVLEMELGSIAKSLKTGDRIDIIANLDLPGFGKATEVILQNIQLIAIDEKNKNNLALSNNNSISFYLTPEEIKIILFMKRYAQFSIALRNPNDNFNLKDQAITLNKFIESEKIKNIIKNDHFQVIYGEKKKK